MSLPHLQEPLNLLIPTGRAEGTTGKQVGNTKEWLGTHPLTPLPLDIQATKMHPQNCSNYFRFKLIIIENIENTKY